MRRIVLFSVLLAAVLFIAGTSRSDVPATTTAPSLPSSGASLEPVSGTAASSAPGDETPPRDPFSAYDVGPPGTKTWTYADLSASEKAEIAAAHDPTTWPQVNNAYAAAAAEHAHQAASDAAAHELGVDNLATTGVVP